MLPLPLPTIDQIIFPLFNHFSFPFRQFKQIPIPIFQCSPALLNSFIPFNSHLVPYTTPTLTHLSQFSFVGVLAVIQTSNTYPFIPFHSIPFPSFPFPFLFTKFWINTIASQNGIFIFIFHIFNIIYDICIVYKFIYVYILIINVWAHIYYNAIYIHYGPIIFYPTLFSSSLNWILMSMLMCW